MNRSTFSDDTTSGRWSTGLRGPRKVTVVARAEDPRGFDWLAAFKRDFLPDGVEAKSTTVLAIMEAQPRARDQVLGNVAGYAIIIVDLYEFRRRVLGDIVDRLRPVIPPGLDPYDFVLQIPYADSNAHRFLRQMAVRDSVLGRLESLLEWSANPLPDGMKKEGLEAPAFRQQVELTNRAPLEEMDDRQFAGFLARVGAAIGDTLSPERQADVLARCLEEQRYFVGDYFACQLLRLDIETDKTYDIGPAPVLRQLEEADNRIWQFVECQVDSGLAERVRRGVLHERVSHTELGLQAADIAAALASREYELAPGDDEGARIRAVKRLFDRILFNGRWV